MNATSPAKWPDAFLWWIDGVGGFLTLTKPSIRIGQAGTSENDIAVLADVSRHHADLFRGESSVMLLAKEETFVNEERVSRRVLRHQDRIRMRQVGWKFHQPVAWCPTARLELTTPHRLPAAVDGIILLSSTCILGDRSDAHIPAPWREPLFVTFSRGQYWIRGPGKLWIDGTPHTGHGPMSPGSTVQASFGSFRWEPIAAVASRRS